MVWTTLDIITKRYLLSRRLPKKGYYLECLTHSAFSLQELTMDTLKVINSIELSIDGNGIMNLPDDCLDWVAVGQRIGQKVRPLAQTGNITQLNNRDSGGNIIPYGTSDLSGIDAFSNWPVGFTWTNINEFGEFLGRDYGYDTENASPNGFKFFRERNQIQFLESVTSTTAVLDYISDGQSVDNATRVNPYAHATIEAFIDWKRSANSTNDQSPEARSYKNQRKILRARISGLTIADIKRAMQGAYKLSIKN